jgi:hypothetical protein
VFIGDTRSFGIVGNCSWEAEARGVSLLPWLAESASSSAFPFPFLELLLPFTFKVELEFRRDLEEDFPLTISKSLEEPRVGACTFLNFQRTPKSPDTRGTFVIW